MYSTCIFCYHVLPANDAVEAFPVGRRLAFDPAKGRLWAVCARCERWNLVPVEERWEAVEACERLFRGTRLRASTPQIGLARLGDGTDLVRIGEPLRPEMAAWRYGDQFGRRRRRHFTTIAGIGVGGAVAVALGFGPGVFSWAATYGIVRALGGDLRPMAQVRLPGHDDLTHVGRVSLLPLEEGDGPRLRVEHEEEVPMTTGPGTVACGRSLDVSGDDAIRIMSVVLAGLNHRGAPTRQVREAVGLLENLGEPRRYFTHLAGLLAAVPPGRRHAASLLDNLPLPTRLALEMATHEESERAALEGELAVLHQRWAEADAVAAIADGVVRSPAVEERLREMKRRLRRGS